jgi:hypothetical protein
MAYVPSTIASVENCEGASSASLVAILPGASIASVTGTASASSIAINQLLVSTATGTASASSIQGQKLFDSLIPASNILFDGSASYVSCPVGSGVSFAGSWEVSFTLTLTKIHENSGLFYVGDSGDSSKIELTYLKEFGGVLRLYASNYGADVVAFSTTQRVWPVESAFVRVVWNFPTVSIYINNVLAGSGTASANSVAATQFRIGFSRRAAVNTYCRGYIGNFKLNCAGSEVVSLALNYANPTSFPDEHSHALAATGNARVAKLAFVSIPYTPASDRSVIGWWDTSRDDGVSISGSNLTGFTDLSGYGNSVSGSVPFISSGINNLRSANFSGSQNLTKPSHNLVYSDNPLSFFVVATYTGTSAVGQGRDLCGWGSNSYNGSRIAHRVHSNYLSFEIRNEAINPGSISNISGTPYLLDITHPGGNFSLARGAVNGVPYDNGGSNATLNIASGYEICFGTTPTYRGDPWSGLFSSAIVTAKNLSSLERERVEWYLGSRFGLLSLFPDTHSFKNSTPYIDVIATEASIASCDGQSSASSVYFTGQLQVLTCEGQSSTSSVAFIALQVATAEGTSSISSVTLRLGSIAQADGINTVSSITLSFPTTTGAVADLFSRGNINVVTGAEPVSLSISDIISSGEVSSISGEQLGFYQIGPDTWEGRIAASVVITYVDYSYPYTSVGGNFVQACLVEIEGAYAPIVDLIVEITLYEHSSYIFYSDLSVTISEVYLANLVALTEVRVRASNPFPELEGIEE